MKWVTAKSLSSLRDAAMSCTYVSAWSSVAKIRESSPLELYFYNFEQKIFHTRFGAQMNAELLMIVSLTWV